MQDNNNIPETIPNKATVHINMDLKEGMFVPGLSPAAPFTPGFTFTHQDFPLKLYSRKETAKILGVSTKAVERRIYHAREILRQKLSKYLA